LNYVSKGSRKREKKKMKSYNFTKKIRNWLLEEDWKVVIKKLMEDTLVVGLVWVVPLSILGFVLINYHVAINNFIEWQYNYHPFKYRDGFFVDEEEKKRWELAFSQLEFIMSYYVEKPVKIFVYSIIMIIPMSVFWTIVVIMFWLIWFIIRIGPVINAMIGDGIYREMKIRRIRKKKEALHRRMPNIFGKELGALSSFLKR
jgi:hypothetical protein